MLSVYAVCAVTANPNSWSRSTNFRYGGSRFQLHPVMFSTLVEHLSFWPTWQVMLLLDQRDWGKLLLVALPETIVFESMSMPTRAEQNTWLRGNTKYGHPILLSDAFYLSIYTDISFKSFGFILIDTLCECWSHLFWLLFITLLLSGISYIVWERT